MTSTADAERLRARLEEQSRRAHLAEVERDEALAELERLRQRGSALREVVEDSFSFGAVAPDWYLDKARAALAQTEQGVQKGEAR